jgi:hypothetical protein
MITKTMKKEIEDMNEDELRMLNRYLCDVITAKRQIRRANIKASLRVGDTVCWRFRDGGHGEGIVEKIKTAKAFVKQTNRAFGTRTLDIHITLLKKVEPTPSSEPTFDPTTGEWN